MPRTPPGIEPRQKADGKWTYRIRWREGGGRDGRVRSESFDLLADARDFQARLLANGRRHPGRFRGEEPSIPRAKGAAETFAAFGRRYIESLTGVGDGWRLDCLADLDRYMAPVLGDLQLAQVDAMAARTWVRHLEEGTLPGVVFRHGRLAPQTVHRLVTQAGAIMRAAMDAELVPRDPFRKLNTGRRDRDLHDEMTVLTREEWDDFRLLLPEGRYRDLCTMLVLTGLRWSEATALPVGAVDVLASPPRLHVGRAWKWVRAHAAPDGTKVSGRYVLGPPKTRRSRRTLTFTDEVREVLIPYVAASPDDALVFTTQRGRPIRASNFHRDVWGPAVSAFAGDVYDEDGELVRRGPGKRPRVHDLRHTFASWLIDAGRPMVSVQRRLGHQSITTTVDRYTHLLPPADSGDLAALR